MRLPPGSATTCFKLSAGEGREWLVNGDEVRDARPNVLSDFAGRKRAVYDKKALRLA